MKKAHESWKILQSNFDILWTRLNAAGEQQMVTPKGHKFTASSSQRKEAVENQDPRFIKVKRRTN